MYSNDWFTDEMSKQLFQEAMCEAGHVSLRTVVLLLIGVAGAGKTCFCHFLFNEPPPAVRESTPLAQAPVRAMSFSRATSQLDGEEVVWERVSPHRLNYMIADEIKGIKRLSTDCLDSVLSSQHTSNYFDTVSDFQDETIGDEIKNMQDSALPDSNNKLRTVEKDSHPMDVEQLFESKSVQELVGLISKTKGSEQISKREWLYIIDSGGQPQFHDLLPTFVRHISAAAFFVKLNERLDDRPYIMYYSKGGKRCGCPYQSSQNHLQIVQNCLQAVQCGCKDIKNACYPDLFFIGTHRDQHCSEPPNAKNKRLEQLLLRHKHNFVSHKKGHLLYEVNSTKTRIDADKRVVADFRRAVMKTCTHVGEVPIRWFVLEQLLQQLSNNGVISFEKCKEVARRLGMQEKHLQAALNHFVKLNIFEYFPSILPNVVFTTSQVLLNKVTELVEYSHYLHDGSYDSSASNIHSVDFRFRDYGELTVGMLKRKEFSQHYVPGLFESKDILQLWKELLVVAKCNTDTFVMPAVLSILPQDELNEHRLDVVSAKIAPFAIHYPGGLFPSGIFSSLISHLQSKCGWKISMENEKPECLHRNCVTFSDTSDVDLNITLIYFHEWIEVHMSPDEDEDEQKCCCLIRDTLFSGLSNAQRVQNYGDLRPKLAFLCNCNSEKYQHLATVTRTKKKLQCSQCTTKREPLTEKYQAWLHSIDCKSFIQFGYH